MVLALCVESMSQWRQTRMKWGYKGLGHRIHRSMHAGACGLFVALAWIGAGAWALSIDAPPDAVSPESPVAPAVFRDPFWPVGYTPAPEPVAQPVVATQDKEPPRPVLPKRFQDLPPTKQAQVKSRIRVGGILKQGNAYHALINNQMVAQGDRIAVPYEGVSFFFVVKTLNENNVLIEPVETPDDDTQ